MKSGLLERSCDWDMGCSSEVYLLSVSSLKWTEVLGKNNQEMLVTMLMGTNGISITKFSHRLFWVSKAFKSIPWQCPRWIKYILWWPKFSCYVCCCHLCSVALWLFLTLVLLTDSWILTLSLGFNFTTVVLMALPMPSWVFLAALPQMILPLRRSRSSFPPELQSLLSSLKGWGEIFSQVITSSQEGNSFTGLS